MSEINAVIFDLGNVLINVDSTELFQVLRDCGLEDDLEVVIKKCKALAYERGEVSDEEFFLSLAELCPRAPSLEQLSRAWLNMFSPIKEMLETARQVREKVPVYILTNTNNAHYIYLKKEYALEELADSIIASHLVGSAKPEERIYRIAEKQWSIVPERTLYFDDKEENIRTALELGWRAFVHRNFEETVRVIKEYGLL
ncbi:MAG: HAD family phosphatase [Candidatus Dadabacteria bacterium]|nr:MAG: HAD family phosphatase [Candidatus Dadabacteria bacterium]